MPTASLVVPSRGGRDRLPILLKALSQQSRDDWEAVIVLDGDVDGSADFLQTVNDDRVRVVEFRDNRGRSAALNAGHQAARGDVLIRCDDDLEPGLQFVERHVSRHQDQDCGVVGLYVNRYPDNRYAEVYGRPQDFLFRQQAYATVPEMRWRYWAGNVSVTRDQWERVGPYDLTFRAYGWEDVDWGYRLHTSGAQVVLDPSLETTHHVAATTTKVRALRAYAAGAAREKFLEKHGRVLPEAPTSGWWNRASEFFARVSGERMVAATGSAVDRAAPFLPGALAGKATAFTVESAGRAGARQRPERDVTVSGAALGGPPPSRT
ncbi:glycosyltransferase family 2 protein [Ornithinimicrobium sp. Y1847]|uniref:glycosyltransferase family 2 protein n=1 Tax=Ornithinimicrobium sp. Y1847 TaxID=3405419 RepID=UPI003B67CAD8